MFLNSIQKVKELQQMGNLSLTRREEKQANMKGKQTDKRNGRCQACEGGWEEEGDEEICRLMDRGVTGERGHMHKR